ncbi:MAG: glycosyltransferase family 39 protein [Anaerolineales bacterium]
MLRTTSWSQALLLGAQALLAALVCYFVGAFLYIAFSRMNYVFTLEWLEGASLIQVHRLLAGQPLYAKPSFEFVSLIYSPLYFYFSSLLARIIGFGFLPLRLVSFASTLGCVALIYLIARKHIADNYSSLMAAGSFLALYKTSDTWFDLARVDMLALFLTLLTIYLMQSGSTIRLLLAGIALSLVCITKQSFWILAPPLFVYAFFLHWRRALIMVLATLVSSAIAHLLLNAFYQGWYSYFVYTLGFGQGQSSIFDGGLVHFFTAYWLDAVIKQVPIFLLLFLLYFVIRLKDRAYRASLGLLALAGGMVLLSWLGILNKGGYSNVLMPSYVMFLLGTWLLISHLLRDPAVSSALRTAVLVLYCVQLLYLIYPVGPQIPTQADFRAGQALLDDIKRQPRDVYIPFDNYLALYAGKKPFAGFGALGDLNQLNSGAGKRDWNSVNAQLRTLIKDRYFSLIILDENADWGSAEHYFQPTYKASRIAYLQDAFFPVAGWHIRPFTLYTPAPVR